jgi:uncharacterized protein (TIGR02996 family)
VTPLTDPIASALLAAIAESDDPTPRYALADWLEERGDARAAWVRHPDVWPYMVPDARNPLPDVMRELHDGIVDPDRMRLTLLAIGAPAVGPVRDWVRVDPEYRLSVGDLLLRAVPPAKLRPVGELVGILSERQTDLAWEALLDLGFHGAKAAPAIGVLLDLVFDYYIQTFVELCVHALSRIGPAAATAFPVLMSQIHDDRIVAALQATWPDPELVYQHLCVEYENGLQRSLVLLHRVDPSGIDYLIRCLSDGRAGVAEEAAQMIGSLGEAGGRAVPAMIRQLGQPGRAELHARIAEALPKLGPAARAAIGPLRDALAGHAAGERRTSDALGAALAALEATEELMSAALSRLEGESPDARELALITLDRVAQRDGQVATHTARALRDPSAAVRWTAVHLLRTQIGPGSDAAEVVPPLLAAIQDETSEIRSAAAVALGEVAGNGLLSEETRGPVLSALFGVFDEIEEEVSRSGFAALLRWAESLPPGQDEPDWLITSEDTQGEQIFAFRRLWATFPGEVFPRVIAQLRANVGVKVMGVLREIGGPAVPALIQLLEGDDAAIGRALRALDGMGPVAAPAAAAVARHFRSDDEQRRRTVVSLLSQFGAPEISLPILCEAMCDPEPRVRAQAADSAGDLGEAAGPILPNLLDLIVDPIEWVRSEAFRGAMRIATDPAVTLPLLRHALADRSLYWSALDRIGTLGPQAEGLFDEVAAHCSSQDSGTRLDALRALIAIGPAGRALPYAQALAADPEEYVREGALPLLAQCQVWGQGTPEPLD